MAVRLRDVAERAGVSIRTVSYAVNSPERVAPETLARVLAIVDELGYAPDAVARGLRTGRSGLIGLIVPGLETPYFAEITSELVRAMAAEGLTLVVDQTDGDIERERDLLVGGSRASAFDGLIASPLALTADDLTHRHRTAPIVLLGERLIDEEHDHVLIDNVRGAYDATRHLIDGGYRSIAFLGRQEQPRSSTSTLRFEGYVHAMDEAGIEVDRASTPVDDFSRATGLRTMSDILGRAHPPDAVFCVSDELALGAMRAAHVRGVSVPDELGIIGFDDIEDGRFSTPTLTTVSPDKKQLAERAVALLLRRLAGSDAPASTAIIEHRVMARESTRTPTVH